MADLLTHSPADVIAKLLVDLGLGSDVEADVVGQWPVSVASEPPSPDNALTVYNTAGRLQGRIQFNGDHDVAYGFTVRVRAVTSDVGFVKATALAAGLDSVVRRVVTREGFSYLVHSISRTTPVVPGGREGTSSRELHTINGVVTLTPLL